MSRKSSKLSEAVLADIMQKIESGEYAPGTQLPNEIVLAEQMGVSRTTIREAENHLVTMNILSKTRGRGTFVLDKQEQLEEAKEYDSLNYMKSRLADLYNLRMIMEPGIASLAAIKATDEDIEKIEKINAKIEKKKMSSQKVMEYNHQFHSAIVAATHNPILIRTFAQINDSIYDNFDVDHTDNMNNDDMLRGHKLIVEFIKIHDAIGARKAMELHIKYSINDFNIKSDNDQ